MTDSNDQIFRIPNLPLGKLVDESGNATMEFQTFLQTFVSNMQKYFGSEGMVAPSQSAVNILQIQNNTIPNSSNPSVPVYSCEPGTFIYNLSSNAIMVSVLSGGVPVFKTVTVT